MKIIRYWLFLCAIIYGCSSTLHYPQSFVNRLADNKIDAGCIVFPIEKGGFKIEQNQIVRGRLYYDYYRERYVSYNDFLYALLNQAPQIYIPAEFTYDTFTRSSDIEKLAKRDFMQFKTHYLDKISTDTYQVKTMFKGEEKQILKACFDNGLYIYYSCLDDSYTICFTPQLLPEPY